jgi:sugar fermentation stimulation protein
MRYPSVARAVFLERPNRFVALVETEQGERRTCHVKNTGRCRELLVPGAKVILTPGTRPGRKTAWDLVAVWKGERLINMDAQAPNQAALEALEAGLLGPVEDLRAEQRHGDSRFDFAFQKDGRPCFLEVKGVTLEEDGVVRFPDAPTLRGARHLRELADWASAGNGAYLLLVIQMEGVEYFAPNDATDPAFGAALRAAAAAGVNILAWDCRVTEDSMCLRAPVPIHL